MPGDPATFRSDIIHSMRPQVLNTRSNNVRCKILDPQSKYKVKNFRLFFFASSSLVYFVIKCISEWFKFMIK